MKPDSLIAASAPKDTLEVREADGEAGKEETSEPAEKAGAPEKPEEAKAEEAKGEPEALGKRPQSPGTDRITAEKPAPPKARLRPSRVTKGTRTVARKQATRRPRADVAPRNGRPSHDPFTEADRVSSELERTERFVGRAHKAVLLSKNTRAIKLLSSALDFQSDSRDAFKVRQYARAERLTLASRDFADRASRMVGPPREDPDYVERVLRRTDDALERAKDVLRTGAGRFAWTRHEGLKQEQKEAWRAYKNGEVGTAYKQTQGVREGVLALLRQLQDLPVPREAAEKAIGGAQAALEQASRELGPKPSAEAVRLVRLAGEYLVKARQSFHRGSYRSALLQAKVVERHIEHAVDVGRPRSG